MSRGPVVLGLGSASGDDQFGWAVVDGLGELGFDGMPHKISHPIDVLTWLDSVGPVHLVDAAIGLNGREPFECLHFFDEATRARIRSLPTLGTHDLDLYSTIRLAESLGKPVAQATLWLGYASQFAPMSGLSDRTRRAVNCCVAELSQHLRDG